MVVQLGSEIDGHRRRSEHLAVDVVAQLCEQGWLERRFHDGQMAYWWTRAAEMALDLNQLVESGQGRES